jgi:iron complex transport system substrate-binding protein
MPGSPDLDEITGDIVDAAVKLHIRLGPGLLESVYEKLLAQALERRGRTVERQVLLDFEFDGLRFDKGLRVDMLVDGIIVVELKSVEMLAPVHKRQLLTYLRLLDLPLGLLINFGAPTLKAGLQRVVNGYDSPLFPRFRARPQRER